MKYSVLIVLALSLFSCGLFETNNPELAVARVGEKYLFSSELEGLVPENSSEEDSLLIINSYINNWVKENLILVKAELNLSEDKMDFEKQLEDYRRTLVIYTYEKELVRERLDTIISQGEIAMYYENNKQNFELKDDITKVRYVKVRKNAPQLKKVRKYYRSDKEKDIEELKEYCHQYAEKFHLKDDEWILFDELIKEVPIKANDRQEFLKHIDHVELEDSLSVYFVLLKDYKLKNDISPLAFETENIENIIINKRKLELITKIKNDLFEEALLSKDFEIYDLKKENDE